MPPVTIYTTRLCPYCASAKTLLKKKNVSFSEIDVSGDHAARGLMTKRANGAHHGAADLHRRPPCRRLRRPLRPRGGRTARLPARGLSAE